MKIRSDEAISKLIARLEQPTVVLHVLRMRYGMRWLLKSVADVCRHRVLLDFERRPDRARVYREASEAIEKVADEITAFNRAALKK